MLIITASHQTFFGQFWCLSGQNKFDLTYLLYIINGKVSVFFVDKVMSGQISALIINTATGKTPLTAILMVNTALTYSYLAVTGDAFISRATPINRIDGKGHNLKLKSNRNHLSKSYKIQIIQGPNHATGYLCPQGWIHTYIRTCTYTDTCTKVISGNQVHSGLWSVCTWFTNKMSPYLVISKPNTIIGNPKMKDVVNKWFTLWMIIRRSKCLQ